MQHTTVHPIVLDLPEGNIEARIELSAHAERLVDLASKMLELSSAVADMGARAAQRLGLKVSCRKGCGHCCRQLVPIAAPEAAMIFEFVQAMTGPRRDQIFKRFSAAMACLKKNALLSQLGRLNDPSISDAEQTAITRRYFQMRIACPFLEDECCGIYDVRPSMCREYLVCSPADHCRDPYEQRIDKLPVSMRLSQALSQVWAGMTQSRPVLIPLVLALHWTTENGNSRTLAAKPGPLLRALLKRISENAAAFEL